MMASKAVFLPLSWNSVVILDQAAGVEQGPFFVVISSSMETLSKAPIASESVPASAAAHSVAPPGSPNQATQAAAVQLARASHAWSPQRTHL